MKKYLSVILIIIAVASISIFATRFFDSKMLDKKLSNSKGYLLYNKNDIKIYENGSSDTVIEPSYANTNIGAENYVHVVIEDGNKRPINIVYLNFDAMPLIQTVNENFIVIPMISAVRTIDSVFIANRETREVLRYPMDVSKETYIAFTNDAQKFIIEDFNNKQLVVMDSKGNEIQRLTFSEEENGWVAHAGASVSPDNKYVAFLTTLGSYENPKFGVFIYNILKNSIQKLGEIGYAERIEWKDDTTFITVITENDSGIITEKEQDRFTIK